MNGSLCHAFVFAFRFALRFAFVPSLRSFSFGTAIHFFHICCLLCCFLLCCFSLCF